MDLHADSPLEDLMESLASVELKNTLSSLLGEAVNIRCLWIIPPWAPCSPIS